MIQTIITLLVVTICLILAGIYVYRALTSSGSPCDNCPGCALKEEMKKKKGKCSTRNRL